MDRILLRLAAPAAAIILLAGCAQTTLTAAGDLGKAGQLAATQMDQVASISASQVTAYQMATVFHRGYMPAQPGSAAAQRQIDGNIQTIRTQLATRAKFLDSLAKCYAALSALAGYDATGSFNTAFAGLTTDTNALLATLKQPGLPASATGHIGSVAGLIVGQVQKQQVIAASRAMRAPLNGVIAAMTQDEPDFVDLADIYTRETRVAAIDLYASHLFSVVPLLDEMGAAIALTAVPDADQIVNKDPRLHRAMNALILQRAAQQDKLMVASYEQSLAALRALVPMHDALERGAPIDLSTLAGIISQLQSLANALKVAKGN